MMDDKDKIQMALAMARRNGCDCEPDLSIRVLEEGVERIEIAHDAWCYFYQRASAKWN